MVLALQRVAHSYVHGLMLIIILHSNSSSTINKAHSVYAGTQDKRAQRSVVERSVVERSVEERNILR